MKLTILSILFAMISITASAARVNGERDYRAVNKDTYHVYECRNNAWVFIFEQDRNGGPQDD